MTKVEKRTFSITAKQAEFIDAQVDAGDYASGSEVIREGLRLMTAREAEIDRWVNDVVVPSYEKWVADGKPTLTMEEVFGPAADGAQKNVRRRAS